MRFSVVQLFILIFFICFSEIFAAKKKKEIQTDPKIIFKFLAKDNEVFETLAWSHNLTLLAVAGLKVDVDGYRARVNIYEIDWKSVERINKIYLEYASRIHMKFKPSDDFILALASKHFVEMHTILYDHEKKRQFSFAHDLSKEIFGSDYANITSLSWSSNDQLVCGLKVENDPDLDEGDDEYLDETETCLCEIKCLKEKKELFEPFLVKTDVEDYCYNHTCWSADGRYVAFFIPKTNMIEVYSVDVVLRSIDLNCLKQFKVDIEGISSGENDGIDFVSVGERVYRQLVPFEWSPNGYYFCMVVAGEGEDAFINFYNTNTWKIDQQLPLLVYQQSRNGQWGNEPDDNVNYELEGTVRYPCHISWCYDSRHIAVQFYHSAEIWHVLNAKRVATIPRREGIVDAQWSYTLPMLAIAWNHDRYNQFRNIDIFDCRKLIGCPNVFMGVKHRELGNRVKFS